MVNRLTSRGNGHGASRWASLILLHLFAVACPFAAPRAQAQTATGWKGTGGNSSWSNPSNWDNTGPNAGARDLFFGSGWVNAGSSGSTTADNDLSGYNGHKIIFENNASSPSFTISGNGFTLFDFGGASPVFPQIENDSSFLQTFNLSSAQTITLNDTSGSNKAEVNPVNGNLAFGANTTVNLAGTTQLQVWGNNGKTVTFNAPITSSGNSGNNSLALNQNSIVVFNADNTYAGDTFVNVGTLQINNSGANATSAIRLGDTSGTASATLTLVGANTVNTVINARPGSSGTKTVSATNANGTTATLGGHIALDAPMTITSTNAGALINVSQARATVSSSTTGMDLKTFTLTITGAGNVTIGAGNSSFGTVYSNTGGSIVMAGSGTLTINDSGNTYVSGTTIKSGTLLIGGGDISSTQGTLGGSGRSVLLGDTVGSSNAAIFTNGSFTNGNAITVQNGNAGVATIGGNTADASVFAGAITLGTSTAAHNLTVGAVSGGSVEFSGVINEVSSNVGSVTVGDATHTGTVRFSNVANGYGGVTSVTNGSVLEVAKLVATTANNSLGNSSQNAASNLVISGSTLRYVGSGDSSNRLFTFDSNGAIIDVTSGSISYINTGLLVASGSGARTLTLTGTTAGNNFSPVIPNPSSGTTSLTKSGNGSWSLGLANTYSGVTTISGGTLNVGTLAAINTASSIGKGSLAGSAADLVLNGGTLQYTGGTAQPTNRLFSVGTSGGILDASGSDNVNGILNFSATGAIGFNGQSGARTLTLTGSNTGANTLAAAIGDSGGATAVSKTGGGTWILSGTSGYTGLTSVTQGTLRVTGGIASSAVTASGAGTIGGSGTLGALTVDSGGTVAPGNSVGTLNAASADLKSGGTYVWEISNATAAAGSGYDVLNLTGGVGVSATSASTFTVKVTSSAAVTNFNKDQNWVWTIATGGSAVSNFAADKFLIDISQFIDDNAINGAFSIEQNGNDLRIRYTVPEPATMSVLLPLCGIALGRRGNRRTPAK